MQASFDRTFGSSGSPVFDSRMQVVGLHALGSSTSSFELYIDYLKDVVDDLQKGIEHKSGDIGVKLSFRSIGDAQSAFKLPAKETLR